MNQSDNPDQPEKPAAGDRRDKPAGINFFTLIQSVCAAFFGVQSDANRKRDFESGRFWPFVIAGVVFVLIFIGLVWGAVRLLLATYA